MRFAIRDDDTSYFTKPEELEQAYSFVKEGPISLSVVPYTVPEHEKGVTPYGPGIPFGYYPVGDSSALVEYLKRGSYDLMLHGYSHEYRKTDGGWLPEMMWKDEGRIHREMTRGKEYLESVFDRPVRVFVAPSNKVDQRTIRSVEALGMHYSGIIDHRDRDLSARYVLNYIRRWSYRVFTGLRIPDVLDYGGHREMVSYPLDNLEKLLREYALCRKRGAPFSVYTHYWELNSNPQRKALLEAVYNHAIADGARLVGLSDCFC